MSDQEQLPAEPLLKAGPEFHKEATKALEERAATLTAGAESGAIPTTTADIQGAVGLEAISPIVRSDAGLAAAQVCRFHEFVLGFMECSCHDRPI